MALPRQLAPAVWDQGPVGLTALQGCRVNIVIPFSEYQMKFKLRDKMPLSTTGFCFKRCVCGAPTAEAEDGQI